MSQNIMKLVVCKIFFLRFMFLLTTKFVKNSHIYARILFIFLKIVIKQTWSSFDTKFQPLWKDWESSYQVNHILAIFCHLIALILGWNSVKGIRVTKMDKAIKFKGVRGELETKKCFKRQ